MSETYEIYYIQRSSIKYITIDGIVNIEWEDEEQDDNNDCSN